MSDKLIHITAMNKNEERVDLWFKSINEAKACNPCLTNFQTSSEQ